MADSLNTHRGRVALDDGSVSSPSLYFYSAQDYGIYYDTTAKAIAFSAAGSQLSNIQSAGVQLASGTAAAPSLNFSASGSANTGLYLVSQDVLGITSNGTLAASFSTAGVLTLVNQLKVSAVASQFVLGTTNTATISAVAPSAPRVYSIQDAGADANFVMSQGAQTIVGAKTFSTAAIFSLGLTATTNVTISGNLQTARGNVASTATIASLASTTSFVKLTGSTATDLQGIAAGVDGQRLVVWNATGQTLTIRNASGSAASGAKITTTTGADITTTGNGAAEFIYDTDASPAVWVCISSSL